MTYEPDETEIIISPQKDVFQKIAKGETTAVCWDATDDPEYQAMYRLIEEYKKPSLNTDMQGILTTVEGYAQSIIDTDIDPVINDKRAGISAYNPLETWLREPNDTDDVPATIPHRDHQCVGVFFYFNETSGFNTSCIPDQYSGERTEGRLVYANADKSKAVAFPAQSVAVIKLHKTTHFAPEFIPEDSLRLVMHARYDYY